MAEHEYSVRFSSSSRRSLRRLPPNIERRLRSAASGLSVNPRPSGVRKLRGYEREYRIRVGEYRLVYEIEDALRLVVILHISHRRDVYRSR